jgi:N-acetylglutamate synthase-like GNAT family acetyltransferase
MTHLNIQLDRDPSAADLQFLDDRIYDHNASATGHDDGGLFSLTLRDEKGEIVAGLHGWTWARACEIRCLWVNQSLRGQRLGEQLLQMAEDEARAKGCKSILLSSYSFQAPGFYQKYGYQVMACLEDFPPGCQNYVLLKRLEDE